MPAVHTFKSFLKQSKLTLTDIKRYRKSSANPTSHKQ